MSDKRKSGRKDSAKGPKDSAKEADLSSSETESQRSRRPISGSRTRRQESPRHRSRSPRGSDIPESQETFEQYVQAVISTPDDIDPQSLRDKQLDTSSIMAPITDKKAKDDLPSNLVMGIKSNLATFGISIDDNTILEIVQMYISYMPDTFSSIVIGTATQCIKSLMSSETIMSNRKLVQSVQSTFPEQMSNISRVAEAMTAQISKLEDMINKTSHVLNPTNFSEIEVRIYAHYAWTRYTPKEQVQAKMMYIENVFDMPDVYTLASLAVAEGPFIRAFQALDTSLVTIYRQWGLAGLHALKDAVQKDKAMYLQAFGVQSTSQG